MKVYAHQNRTFAISFCLVMLAGCATSTEGEPRSRTPTDAEVEAYNARVPADEQIVCRREVPVGTYIPKRVCRLMADVEDTSTLHRDQLRRVLQ